MNIFKEILEHERNVKLEESIKASNKEISYVISIVNKIYNEWKKTGRRVNAVDLVTTSANKIGTISPDILPHVHEATRLKIATIIMRCMDIAPWKDPASKDGVYKKLFPILHKLQTYDPNTGSGGNLRDTIMTRLSSAMCHQSGSKVFVVYEPKVNKSYVDYLFNHTEKPEHIFRMASFSLPGDYSELLKTLRSNQERAEKRVKQKSPE